ncbi:MAG: dolichyl-phosphate beta-glucosyltransferase [Patescibacteria group bacterium]
MLLSLIIPAYNEEKRIRKTLELFVRELCPGDKEIIVVLNGCTDNTRSVVEQAARDFGSEIKIEELAIGGKGLAVVHGFKKATGDLIGFVDADGATSPREYRKLVEAITQGKADGAIASRWLAGSHVVARTSFFREVISQAFFIITKLLFWLPFRDTQCGAKLFRREVAQAVLPKLKVMNMAFDVELLLLTKQAKYRITEVPTEWIDQSISATFGSPLKVIKTSLNMFFSLFKIRFQHLRS